jgi:hypothetical protein
MEHFQAYNNIPVGNRKIKHAYLDFLKINVHLDLITMHRKDMRQF